MFKILRLFLITAFLSVGAYVYAKDIWYCPMHPHYTSDKPGKCPICGMDLVKKEDHPGAEHTAMALDAHQQQMMGW